MSKARLASLDQFRGYTVAGMLVVNFWGSYQCTPQILKHRNDYCSYADLIMPHFFFAVGVALQIVVSRHQISEKSFSWLFYRRLLIRCGFLMLLALAIYFPYSEIQSYGQFGTSSFWITLFKRDWFQTLTHIAVTTIWILPVLRSSLRLKLLWGIASAGLHILLSYWFYFDWVHANPSGIDGGPLGFLTWSIPTLTGVAAYESIQSAPARFRRSLFGSAILLMAIGYAVSCATRCYDRNESESISLPKLAKHPVWPEQNDGATETNRIEPKSEGWDVVLDYLAEPPGTPPPPPNQRAWNYWMMSQRAGSVSYQTFAAGFSLLVFLLFLYVCDDLGKSLGLFRTLGTNALACYVIHGFVSDGIAFFLKKDSPALWVGIGFGCYAAIVIGVAAFMESRKIFWRL